MGNVVTIRGAVARAKADGLPVSEYTLRGWIKAGLIPVRHAGCKQLLYYPNLVRYLQCEDGGDFAPAVMVVGRQQVKPSESRHGPVAAQP